MEIELQRTENAFFGWTAGPTVLTFLLICIEEMWLKKSRLLTWMHYATLRLRDLHTCSDLGDLHTATSMQWAAYDNNHDAKTCLLSHDGNAMQISCYANTSYAKKKISSLHAQAKKMLIEQCFVREAEKKRTMRKAVQTNKHRLLVLYR